MTPAENIHAQPPDDVPVVTPRDEPHLDGLAPDASAALSVESEASLFGTIVDTAMDAIIVHRPDGTIVFANLAAGALLGMPTSEVLDLPAYGWIAPDMMLGSPRRIEAILHDGRLAFSSAAKRRDGTLLPTEVRSRRIDTALGPLIVAVIRDASERQETQRTLEHLAYHDTLTGLANRALFDGRLAVAIADARRYGDLLGLAYLDLDEFKPVNDRYGHAIGDAVLVEAARRMREGVREQDTVARLGGDEFVLVLPRLSAPDELETIAQRLYDRLVEPILALGHVITVRGSIGLALFDPGRDTARTLLVKADVAMYAAKRSPEHPWLIYDERMDAIERP